MGSNTATVMTLANSIIGVGVLAMPFCFKQCGIALSILMLILSSGLSRLACHYLLKAAIMARRRNFEFLAFHIFGPPGKTIVELFIIGFLMGTCIAFFVVVGDLGPAIVAKLFQLDNTASLRQVVLISLAVGIVLPLGLMRNVSSLAAICTATIGFYLCLVIKVVAEAIPHLGANDWVDKVHFWRPAGLLQCIPIFSMALFCQTQLFEIYESLPNANLDKMNDVVRHAVNLCTGFYIFVGFFGYVAFFTHSFTGNVLMSFSPTWASDAIKIGFVLSVAVSFPLVIFPCRASLYSLLFRRNLPNHNPDPSCAQTPVDNNSSDTLYLENGPEVQMPHETTSTHIPETRFKLLTIAIISVSLTIGIITPNIELVLGLVGSTIGVLICVMFPAVAFICISTKSSNERLLAQLLLFVGVFILVLGTYATLNPAENGDLEGRTFPPDRIDSIARMSLLPVDKAVTPSKVNEFEKQEKMQPKAELVIPESIKDLPAVDMNAAGEIHPEIKEVQLPKVPELEKLNVRKEPPVPVEPPADNPPIMASAVPEKKEEILLPAEPNQLEAAHVEIKKEANNGSSVKKILPDAEKEKISNEQVNQDAIKKEEEELAEAEKQAKAEEEKKNEELLKKLEKHQEEQKKLLQEQKEILQELKEHKKEIDKAAAKKQNDETIQQEVKEIVPNDKNKSLLQNVDKQHLVDNKLPELSNIAPNAGGAQNRSPVKDINNNVVNEINKPAEEGGGDIVEHHKVIKDQKSLNLKDLKTMSEKVLLSKRDKAGNGKGGSNVEPIIQNNKGLDNQKPVVDLESKVKSQEGPVGVPNKLPLPLPLAIRNLTSQYYNRQENVKNEPKADSQPIINAVPPVNEAKVMRREILADEKIGLTSNASQEVVKQKPEIDTRDKAKHRDILSSIGNDKANIEDHDRMKRDTFLEELMSLDEGALISNIRAENDGQEPEKCDKNDKDNVLGESDRANKAPLSDKTSNIYESPQENLADKMGEFSNIERNSVSIKSDKNSFVDKLSLTPKLSASGINSADTVKPDVNLNKAKDLGKEKEEFGEVFTLSSLIRTPSVLSDPKLSDDDVQKLKDAVEKIKDSSIIPKPMARDLKSLLSSQQTVEENEEKKKNT